MTALLLALLIGFHASDCQPGRLVTLYEDMSYTVDQFSDSVTCQDNWQVNGITRYRTISLSLVGTKHYAVRGIEYDMGKPFPETVIQWTGQGYIVGMELYRNYYNAQ
jgi:hypothetical protein